MGGNRSLAKWAVSLFLLLSGASALIYQVVWVRLLGLSIGSTTISISIVLAVFFLGVGLGSYFAGTIIKKFRNALKIYLFAEAGIAISAIALLPLLLNLDYYISMLSISEAGIWLRFFIVTLLLIVPTFLIGTTFALLVAVAIEHRDEIGTKLAHFYAFNSAGAVMGALCSGMFLIPHFGLDGTLYMAASLNFFIVFLGFVLYGTLGFSDSGVVKSSLNTKEDSSVNNRALIVLFATGLSAMATEIGWMKFLIVYTGNTIYGFSLILSMFIAGVTLGSFAAKSKTILNINPEKLLFFGLILLGVALLGARVGLGVFPEIYEQLNGWQVDAFVYRWSKYLVMFLLLLPATALFGLLFPIALKYYSPEVETLHSYVGRAYGVNIVAGIIGSVLAGFWIIPYFSTDTLLSAMALLVLLSSLVFVKSKKISFIWVGIFVIFMGASNSLAHIDYAKMIKIVLERDLKANHGSFSPTIHYIKEGQTGVVGLHSYDTKGCKVILSNNGMNESWIDICNKDNLLLSEFLLGEIPLFLNSSAKKAFVVGYGGGTTLGALSMSELESIDAVELEPAVLDALRTLYDNKLPTDNDKRVNVTINDARNTLLMSKMSYDIIVSQPSHPWLSGASNIMSKDFFEIVKSRLSQNGINGQWIPLYYIDTATLKSVIKAYTDTFENVVSFINPSTKELLMFGSKEPIVMDFEAVQKQMLRPDVGRVLEHHNIKSPQDLMSHFALSREQLVEIAGSAEAATDKNLLTETFKSRYKEIEGNSFDTFGFIKGFINSDE